MALEAVLFDLDNTLVLTDHLQDHRNSGARDLGGLRAALKMTQPVPGLEEAVSAVSTKVQLGIVTRSPRWYAEEVLRHFYPSVTWNVMVAGKEAARYKPYPDGLTHALRELNVSPQNCAYIGDDPDDMHAAYLAGVRPVLTLFKNRNLLSRYPEVAVWPLSHHEPALDSIAEDFCITPEYVLWRPADLDRLVNEPDAMLPVLESSWRTE